MSDSIRKIGLAYLVEADRDAGALVSRFLDVIGYEVCRFDTSQACIAAANNNAPDVILLELANGAPDLASVMRQLNALQFAGFVLPIGARDDSPMIDAPTMATTEGPHLLPALQKPIRLAALREILAVVPHRPRTAHPKQRADVRIDPAEALEKNWIELWYQPKFELRTNRLCGAEALLRASHPDLGVLAPAALLPPSGNDPRHPAILDFVFRRVMSDWRKLGSRSELRISINVPASVVRSGELMRLFGSLPPGSAFPGLTFEIPERDIVDDASWAHEAVALLKPYNVLLSVDEFEAGTASLGRLCDLPFTEFKLRDTFVTGCANNWSRRATCEAAVRLASILGATLCAKGVETAEDLTVVRQLGFDTAQGFLLGPPMPIEKFALTVLGRSLPETSTTAARARSAPGAKLESVA